jgi:hypothetical protein
MYDPNALAAAERAVAIARRKEAEARARLEQSIREIESRRYVARLQMQLETIKGLQAALGRTSAPDPVAAWQAVLAAERAKGLSHTAALQAAWKAHPALYEAYVARREQMVTEQRQARERAEAEVRRQNAEREQRVAALRRKG